MTKYELTVRHDDCTSMTYKFEAEFIHDIPHHLEEFLRASGFTYVETVEIYDENGKQLSADDYRINVADGDDVWSTVTEKFEDHEEAAKEESVPVVAAAKKGSKKSKKKSKKKSS